MPHNVSIAATAEGLNQFQQRFGKKINQVLKQGLELETMLPSVDTEYAYTGQDIEVSDIIQPYQPAFTPNNTESFNGLTNYIRPIKIDLQFTAEQLMKFLSKWRSNWATPIAEDMRKTYAGYIMGQHILPQAMEELNLASWAGQYVAPTAGTPGAVLESVDGFAINITNWISDGRLTPINTGVWDTNNAVSIVRNFCKAVPEPYTYKKGTLLMAKSKAQDFADDYQVKYPNRKVNEEEQDKLYLKVDHYNKTIKGLTCMEGSDRIILVFDNMESLLIGKRTGFPPFFRFRFQEFDRTLKVMAEIYRFYGAETCLHMFTNEQA